MNKNHNIDLKILNLKVNKYINLTKKNLSYA